MDGHNAMNAPGISSTAAPEIDQDLGQQGGQPWNRASRGGERIVLEPVDERLIELLIADGRMTYADLGSHVGLSGDAVRNRVRRLMDDDILEVVGSVPASLLGLESFALVGITVDGPAYPVAQALSELEHADLVVRTSGVFDLIVELVCTDDNHLLSIVDESIRSIPSVTRCQVMMYLSVEKYTPGGPRHALIAEPMPGTAARLEDLDASDRALIGLLKQDGRATYQQLAEETGLTYASTRRRVMKLLDQRTIHIVTIVNQLVYGQRAMSGIGLSINGPAAPVIEEIAALPQVEMIVSTTGPYDLLLEVSCGSRQELAKFIGDTLHAVAGVHSFETHGFVSIHKLPYTWSSF
ncbi:Lrp/AsnC family transcriptional regulator [Rhodococcus koreensis]|uniref:Lrp/AsnC family transcriptional regulator n=1 Tax=Rhodococcus koreensis TaxID=99653 RepID=UPI00366B8B6A